MRTRYALDGLFGALIRLRVPPSRAIVGIDKFAVEPLRSGLRISERFLEIAQPLALFHYVCIIDHKPGNHPFRAVPSQNPLQFWNCLRLHPGLVPKLTDRRSDWRDRANRH